MILPLNVERLDYNVQCLFVCFSQKVHPKNKKKYMFTEICEWRTAVFETWKFLAKFISFFCEARLTFGKNSSTCHTNVDVDYQHNTLFMFVPSTVKKKDLVLFRQFSPGVFFFPRRRQKKWLDWPEDDVIEESQVGGCGTRLSNGKKKHGPLFRGI